MRFVFRKDRGLSLGVLGLLTLSFVLLGVTLPAHAQTSSIVESSVCAGTTDCTLSFTAVTNGNQYAIIFTGENTATITISDTCSSSFTSQTTAGPATGFDGNQLITKGWTVASSACTGTADTITIHSTSTPTTIKALAYDLTNYAVTGTGIFGVFSGTGNDADPGHTLPNLQATGSIVLQACAITGQDLNFPSPQALSLSTIGTTVNVPSCGGQGGRSPRDFWGVSEMALAPTGSIITTTTGTNTVINTACLGACSGGHNATSTYFSTAIPSLFVFYASQNTASAGQIDNFTMKVKSVHINTQTGNLLIGVYMPSVPTVAPSGGNQYSLVKSLTYPISNGSVDFFVHQNPQANICASCYYAAGIMATTTASRGSGATGSGVSFYESSSVSSQQYQFNPGGATLPTTFFSSAVLRPDFFMRINETYTVGTVTVTSTTTSGGTATTTVTTTSTNTINQLDMSKAGFWFLPLLFFLAPMALLIVVKRVADGR